MRRARKQGKIPGVLYGESGNFPIYFADGELRSALRRISGGAALISLDVGGKERLSVLADCQRNCIVDSLVHVDFHEVSMRKKMHAHVPVALFGAEECAGVKTENGVLEFLCHSLEVRCLPKDLPAGCSVDISGLHVGQIVHVRDLPPMDGVEFLGSPDLVIVVCSAMKVQEESTAGTAAESANAAPKA
jgi:large subunit ribosomal protein L25